MKDSNRNPRSNNRRPTGMRLTAFRADIPDKSQVDRIIFLVGNSHA